MTAIEWFNTEPGVYRTQYRGRDLEVVRSQNKEAAKRYIPRINGRDLEACWTAKDAQRKAIKLLQDGDTFAVPVPVLDPVLDIGPPASIPEPAPAEPARVRFAITGEIDLSDFPDAVGRVKMALDLLRESGQAADLALLDMPGYIRL